MQYYKLMVDGENSTDNIYAHPCIEVEDPYMFCYGKEVEKWEPVRFECDIKKGTVITEYLRNSYGWENTGGRTFCVGVEHRGRTETTEKSRF